MWKSNLALPVREGIRLTMLPSTSLPFKRHFESLLALPPPTSSHFSNLAGCSISRTRIRAHGGCQSWDPPQAAAWDLLSGLASQRDGGGGRRRGSSQGADSPSIYLVVANQWAPLLFCPAPFFLPNQLGGFMFCTQVQSNMVQWVYPAACWRHLSMELCQPCGPFCASCLKEIKRHLAGCDLSTLAVSE